MDTVGVCAHYLHHIEFCLDYRKMLTNCVPGEKVRFRDAAACIRELQQVLDSDQHCEEDAERFCANGRCKLNIFCVTKQWF